MRSAAEDASIEETLAKLKQQAADLQSHRENSGGGPPRAAAPPITGLPSSLAESDTDFMRQLAQLKEDHVSNLRVIERMYNEGQGGGGSALPDYDYDDGGTPACCMDASCRQWCRGTHTPAAGTCLIRWGLGPSRAQEPGPRGGMAHPVLAPPASASPLASRHLAALTLRHSPCGAPPAGYAERTDDAFLRAPLDAAFDARVVEQERRSEAAARSQAGAASARAATHDGSRQDGASRPNFSRPLDAGLPDDEYPPPPPPAQDLPPASTSRAHLPPRPASAGPSRSRSIDGLQGQSRAVYQPTLSADVAVDVAASVDGLSHRLAASSSMDDLNSRHDALRSSADHDARRDYDPAAAAAARRRRPASAPRERPRGITIPRPFHFDSRPPRESTSMRRLRLELQERDAQLRDGRNSLRHVPLPASTKEPRCGQTISPEP